MWTLSLEFLRTDQSKLKSYNLLILCYTGVDRSRFTVVRMRNNINNNRSLALARWLRWLECRPIRQKPVSSVPGQGTSLGCGFNPQTGCIRDATGPCFSHIDVSFPPLSPSLPLSLSLSLSFLPSSLKTQKHILGWGFFKKGINSVSHTPNCKFTFAHPCIVRLGVLIDFYLLSPPSTYSVLQ